MGNSKTVNVSFFRIDTNDKNFISAISNELEKTLTMDKKFDMFYSSVNYMWKVLEKKVINNKPYFFITIAKEKKTVPILFNEEDGDIKLMRNNEDLLCDQFYGIFSPKDSFIACMPARTGSGTSTFKHFFNEFSSVSPVRLIPFFEEKIDETVLSWSYFKSISTRLIFPTYEEMETFANSNEGEKLGFITYLSGLKVDINISGSKKMMLSEYPVKDFISSMINNDYCDKLLVKGGDFATEEIGQVDIKNAVVKYSEKVLTVLEYIEDDLAKDILFNAINDKHLILFY